MTITLTIWRLREQSHKKPKLFDSFIILYYNSVIWVINGEITVQLQRLVDFCRENEYNPPILVVKFLRRGFIFVKLNLELIKYIYYYTYNKTPVKINEYLSNGH